MKESLLNKENYVQCQQKQMLASRGLQRTGTFREMNSNDTAAEKCCTAQRGHL